MVYIKEGYQAQRLSQGGSAAGHLRPKAWIEDGLEDFARRFEGLGCRDLLAADAAFEDLAVCRCHDLLSAEEVVEGLAACDRHD